MNIRLLLASFFLITSPLLAMRTSILTKGSRSSTRRSGLYTGLGVTGLGVASVMLYKPIEAKLEASEDLESNEDLVAPIGLMRRIGVGSRMLYETIKAKLGASEDLEAREDLVAPRDVIKRVFLDKYGDYREIDRNIRVKALRKISINDLMEMKAEVESSLDSAKENSRDLTQEEQEELNKLLFECVESGRDLDACITKLARNKWEESDFETTLFLLNNGADPNATKSNGETILMAATKKGDLRTVVHLVARGADVNATDSNGWTAARHAKYGAEWNGAAYLAPWTEAKLCAVHAPWHHMDKVWQTCHTNGRRFIVKRVHKIFRFLEVVTDNPKNPCVEPEGTSIRRPSFNEMGTIEKFDSIKMHKIHPGPLNITGIRDILMMALSAKPQEVVYSLIIGKNGQVWLGHNELSAAKSKRKLLSEGLDGGNQVLECASELLPNELLFEAIESGPYEAIEYLVLRGGADPSATNKYGETALISATKRTRLNAIRWFRNKGADVETIDSQGWSAADHARFDEDWREQKNMMHSNRRGIITLSEYLRTCKKGACKKELSMWYLPKEGSSEQKPVLSVDEKNRTEYEGVQISRPINSKVEQNRSSGDGSRSDDRGNWHSDYVILEIAQAIEKAISRALTDGRVKETPVWQLVKLDCSCPSEEGNCDDYAQIWILNDSDFDGSFEK